MGIDRIEHFMGGDIRHTRDVKLVMKAGRTYDPAELLASVKGTLGPASPQEDERWKRRGGA